MEYEFRCPKCNGTCIEEVMANVTVTTRITSIHESFDFDYGDHLNEDGSIDHYQCANCGMVLETNELYVNEPEELVEWIKENTPD